MPNLLTVNTFEGRKNQQTEYVKFSTSDVGTLTMEDRLKQINMQLGELQRRHDCFTGNYGGVYPPTIQQRDFIHHSQSERIIKALYKSLNHEPALGRLEIHLSRYNPEKVIYAHASSETGTPSTFNDPALTALRDELRRARQATERSMSGPGRTFNDGWGKPTVEYTYTHEGLVPAGIEQPILHPWGDDGPEPGTSWRMSIPDVTKSATLYDVIYSPEGGEKQIFTVFLEPEALFTGENAIEISENDKALLLPEPEKVPGQAIAHAFNCRYCDITYFADEIAASGFRHVLVSPPLTWRKDGLFTAEKSRDEWYHVYQPEDPRVLDNPHGNLQSFFLMIQVLKARGVGVIIDVPLNFMGTGGDGGSGGADNKGTLIFPSTDIQESIIKTLLTNPGLLEAQQIVRTVKTEQMGEVITHPAYPFTSPDDFEPHKANVKDYTNEWQLQHYRLVDLPKLLPNNWILAVQKQFLDWFIRVGVEGFRVDAVKHMQSEHLKKLFTPEIMRDKKVFIEYITTGKDGEYEPFKRRMAEHPEMKAYDFPLQNTIMNALSLGGSLQDLAILPWYNPSKIEPARSVTFVVNHDTMNNECFLKMLPNTARDELLAYHYIFAYPGADPLVFFDGKSQRSVTSIPREHAEDSLGGDAWDFIVQMKTQTMKSMLNFNQQYVDKPGIWFATSGPLATDYCLAFSRGEADIEKGPHTALVVINKSDRVVSGQWPNPLEPGEYEDLGRFATGQVYNVEPDKLLDIVVPPRSAIMLARKRSE